MADQQVRDYFRVWVYTSGCPWYVREQYLEDNGKGKRTGVYGAFLLASYNDESEEFETITKIGTGFSEEGLEAHFKALDGHVIDAPRQYYKWNERLEPDVWFEPTQVLF